MSTQTAVKKKSLLMSGKQLMDLKVIPSEWIVDGLLRIGRKRISLLAGKPEGGKSTIARQLAVAVAKGGPFLGRLTIRGEVLYWQTEEFAEDLQESLRNLGYNPDTDENISFFTGDASENNIHSLHDVVAANAAIKLIIIETLDDLLKFDDIKENTAARKAFDAFDAAVVSKHAHRAAFLALHHLKKRETDSCGDELLGASTIRGRSDAKWYVRTVSDDDPRRIFHTTVRRGRTVPRTYLDFNEKTETSTLGMTVADEKKLGAGKTTDKIKDDILSYFAHNPGKSFKADCLRIVGGNTDLKKKLFKELLANGELVERGKGTKSSPFGYEKAPIPTEETNKEKRAA